MLKHTYRYIYSKFQTKDLMLLKLRNIKIDIHALYVSLHMYIYIPVI